MSVTEHTIFKISSSNTQIGAGELDRTESCRIPIKESDLPHKTVVQILNNIIDKAVDTVLEKNKETTCKNKIIDVKVVSSILENIFAKISNNHTPPNGIDSKLSETDKLDDEIKNLIKDMQFPIKSAENSALIGIGDQVASLNDVGSFSSPLNEATSPKSFNVEKKCALTNLVKNSKIQFLSKFNLNESIRLAAASTSDHNDSAEDMPEIILNVIELDCLNKYDIPFVVEQKILVPPLDEDTIRLPSDSVMDMVELYSIRKADNESKVDNDTSQSISGDGENAQVEIDFDAPLENVAETIKKKKKKWNFGLKFVNFMKRKNSKKDEDVRKQQ